jgi:hypothetical protein
MTAWYEVDAATLLLCRAGRNNYLRPVEEERIPLREFLCFKSDEVTITCDMTQLVVTGKRKRIYLTCWNVWLERV